MAIEGWTGPTRHVPGIGECPVVYAETPSYSGPYPCAVVYLGFGRVVAIGNDPELAWVFDLREGYRMVPFRPAQLIPISLAALNALAAAHGGTWRAQIAPAADTTT